MTSDQNDITYYQKDFVDNDMYLYFIAEWMCRAYDPYVMSSNPAGAFD